MRNVKTFVREAGRAESVVREGRIGLLFELTGLNGKKRERGSVPALRKVDQPAPLLVRELTLKQKSEPGIKGGALSEPARRGEPPGAARKAELGSRAGDYVRERGRSTIFFQGRVYRRTELHNLVTPATIAASQTDKSRSARNRRVTSSDFPRRLRPGRGVPLFTHR